ncbi:hypothetical protein JMUB7546_26970 [Staphylococcus aureus]
MSASLVGSEMCIRDSVKNDKHQKDWNENGEFLGDTSSSVSYTHLTLPTTSRV